MKKRKKNWKKIQGKSKKIDQKIQENGRKLKKIAKKVQENPRKLRKNKKKTCK